MRGWFKCRECGYEENADVNGAKNILSRYLHQVGQPTEGSSGIVGIPRVIRWDRNVLSEPDARQFIGG
ncbi:MAG: transposase [Methanomicrobia archaeon]|nr:transposase [Methanomicrobia archaeon]